MKGLKILTIFLMLVFLLQGCAKPGSTENIDEPRSVLDDYLIAIENNVPSNMNLTIYFTGFDVSFLYPPDEEDLINWGNSGEIDKIVIDSAELESRIDQLKKIDSSVLQTPKKRSHKDARLYYYIETETAGKVLEVSMNGLYGTMFVNGTEVEYNPVFYDVVSPYLETSNTGDS